MKKILMFTFVLLAVVPMAFVLTACGGNGNNENGYQNGNGGNGNYVYDECVAIPQISIDPAGTHNVQHVPILWEGLPLVDEWGVRTYQFRVRIGNTTYYRTNFINSNLGVTIGFSLSSSSGWSSSPDDELPTRFDLPAGNAIVSIRARERVGEVTKFSQWSNTVTWVR